MPLKPLHKKTDNIPYDADIYDDVVLKHEDDARLERMRSDLSDAYEKHRIGWTNGGISFEKAHFMIDAAHGYASTIAEQRERAMIRARQKRSAELKQKMR